MKSIPLKIAPLQLSSYVITSYSYAINLDALHARMASPVTSQIEVDFDVRGHASDPSKFLIDMSIDLNKKPSLSKKNLYQISLRILGEFQTEEGLDEASRQKLVFNDGSAIIYGIARGAVAQFTGSYGTDRHLLPAVNLLSILKSKRKKPGNARSSAKQSR